jgi:hypothetical protein
MTANVLTPFSTSVDFNVTGQASQNAVVQTQNVSQSNANRLGSFSQSQLTTQANIAPVTTITPNPIGSAGVPQLPTQGPPLAPEQTPEQSQVQTQEQATAGPLTLQTSNAVSLEGNHGGNTQTQSVQNAVNTDQGKTVSNWTVNNLTPGKNGTAIADVTHTLQIAAPDGTNTTIGQGRTINYRGQQVAMRPRSSRFSQSTTRFKMVMHPDGTAAIRYKARNANGERTVVTSRITQENGAFVGSTTGTRTSTTGISTLDGLSGFAPAATNANSTNTLVNTRTNTNTPINTTNNGVMAWLQDQWATINQWIRTGSIVATA